MDSTTSQATARSDRVFPKVLMTSIAAVAACLSAGGASAQGATQNAPGVLKNKSHDVYYNVCRGTDPQCLAQNNGWAEPNPATKSRVLIYSRTAGPRHANLGTSLAGLGLNPPLNANNVMQATLIAWMAEEGITADWTEDANRFTEAPLLLCHCSTMFPRCQNSTSLYRMAALVLIIHHPESLHCIRCNQSLLIQGL
jgi:hypothetical protein